MLPLLLLMLSAPLLVLPWRDEEWCAGTASLIMRSTVARAARSCCFRSSESRGTDRELRSRCSDGGGASAAAAAPEDPGAPRVAFRNVSRAMGCCCCCCCEVGELASLPPSALAIAAASAAAPADPARTSSSEPAMLALPLNVPLMLPASSVDPSKLPLCEKPNSEVAVERFCQFELLLPLPYSSPTPSPPGDARSACSLLLAASLWLLLLLLLLLLRLRLPELPLCWPLLLKPARSQPAVAFAALAKAEDFFGPPAFGADAAPASAQFFTSISKCGGRAVFSSAHHACKVAACCCKVCRRFSAAALPAEALAPTDAARDPRSGKGDVIAT